MMLLPQLVRSALFYDAVIVGATLLLVLVVWSASPRLGKAMLRLDSVLYTTLGVMAIGLSSGRLFV